MSTYPFNRDFEIAIDGAAIQLEPGGPSRGAC